MLARKEILRKSVNLDILQDHACPDSKMHFGEIASNLMPGEFDALMADLDSYDRIGAVTPRLEDMIRRSECIAQADRILSRLNALNMAEPRS